MADQPADVREAMRTITAEAVRFVAEVDGNRFAAQQVIVDAARGLLDCIDRLTPDGFEHGKDSKPREALRRALAELDRVT